MSNCPFQARARNRVGFRKSGLCPLPGRPRPRGYFHKVPKAQWALRGGWGAPGLKKNRNCMSVSLNRGEMCISSLVWLCLGGPGRPDRPWRRWRSMGDTRELPQPPRGLVGPWGVFFQRNCMSISLNRGEICMGGVFMSGPIQAEPDQCEYDGGRMYPNYP